MSSTIFTTATVGALYGLAYGDAWGDPVEFRRYPTILDERGEPPLPPEKMRITDDTQMSLAVWNACSGEVDPSQLVALRAVMAREFLMWLRDADNNRAPGGTCLTALGKLETALHRVGLSPRNVDRVWQRATVARSDGCGAVMRAPWLGVHPRVDDAQLATVARMQAALTHGHPAATAGAAAVAELTRALVVGDAQLGGCAAWLQNWASRQARALYDRDALEGMARRNGMTPATYQAAGARAVGDAGAAAARSTYGMRSALLRDGLPGLWWVDPCTLAGKGWDAASCLAAAVACVDLCGYVTDGPEPLTAITALRRAAATGGDSDSIAAVAGALLGAAFGPGEWPAQWRERLEPRYRAELATAVEQAVAFTGAR